MTELGRVRRLGPVDSSLALPPPNIFLDYLFAVAAFPISWIMRVVLGSGAVGPPLNRSHDTLPSIRQTFAELLPGTVIRRRLFFRHNAI